jgi:hypothetical protein
MLLLYLIGRKYLKRDLSVYTIQINEKSRKMELQSYIF